MKKYILVKYDWGYDIDVNKNYQRWFKNDEPTSIPILSSDDLELLNNVKRSLENEYN